MKRWVEKQTLAACAVLRAKKRVNRRMWFIQQSFSQKQHKHQMAVVTKHEEAFNHDRDYICRIQTALEPFSSKSMSYFIERWNFRKNFGNSMANNHTARKQLCGSVQSSTNNMTTGKSIKANSSRSTSTATLALLDIVNWTRQYHNVHWNQLILVDTFRLNFSKTTKEKKYCAGLLFKNWATIWNPQNQLAGIDTGRSSRMKVCRAIWKVRLIL